MADLIDKARRLRRYDRKDYSLVVDFPVEIVGRDGVVRRYSFEDSIRLYQRRIASANLRYHDGDVAEAEVAHCRRRIDQLRRSYFARYGWSSLQRVRGSAILDDGLAGEVAAFLRRALVASESNADTLSLTYVEGQETPHLFFVQPGELEAAREHFLLYVYRFETAGDCQGRAAFLTQLRQLMAVRAAGQGVESLLASHHTADCGLVLTGRPGSIALCAESEHDASPLELSWLEAGGDEESPAAGLLALRQGKPAEALSAFLRAQEENPWRRSAAVGALLVADALGDGGNMETAALLGVRHFPSDVVFWHGLAVARLRLGELAGAREALSEAERLGGPSAPGSLVGAVLALRQLRALSAHRAMAALRRLDHGQHPEHEPARRCVVAMQGAVIGGDLGAVGLAVAGAWLRGPSGLVVASLIGLFLVFVVRFCVSRELARRIAGRPVPLRLARASVSELS